MVVVWSPETVSSPPYQDLSPALVCQGMHPPYRQCASQFPSQSGSADPDFSLDELFSSTCIIRFKRSLVRASSSRTFGAGSKGFKRAKALVQSYRRAESPYRRCAAPYRSGETTYRSNEVAYRTKLSSFLLHTQRGYGVEAKGSYEHRLHRMHYQYKEQRWGISHSIEYQHGLYGKMP